jgi:uncharacterized membrane protein YeaQ/YmgE (transglycosylase-associated protein family)
MKGEADVGGWIALLISGIVGIGIAIIISQMLCQMEPATCSVFPPIIGAAIFGLIVGLKYWFSR